MAGFDFVCPKSYPWQCDLFQTEVDYLRAKEGFKNGFLMYQFREQDPYLVDTIKSYFSGGRNCQIWEAKTEPGSGIKICKICKYATASNFGIGVLSPENLNVHLEIGLMWGQGKPILFIANPMKLGKKLSEVAFDVSDFVAIEYSSQKQLDEGLKREGPAFLEKVRVMGLYQQSLVESVRERLKRLKKTDPANIEFLKMLLMIAREDFGSRFLGIYIRIICGDKHPFNDSLHRRMEAMAAYGFLEIEKVVPIIYEHERYHFTKELLPSLRQEAFKEIE